MTWEDLSTDVAELFSDVRLELSGGVFRASRATFSDPHTDATRWIDATEAERLKMRPVFEERLAKLRARNASALALRPKKAWRREPAKQAERMREYRTRPVAKAKDNARSSEWRRKNKIAAAAYLREWRKRKKASLS